MRSMGYHMMECKGRSAGMRWVRKALKLQRQPLQARFEFTQQQQRAGDTDEVGGRGVLARQGQGGGGVGGDVYGQPVGLQ
jgi:hypothetical protein